MTELLTMARDAGFEETAPLHAAQLVFRPEVREMCRADRCSSYGKNWCCPPACPSLEEMTRRMQDYGAGVLVETVGVMADDFDYEAIMAAEALHKERLRRLTGTLYNRYGREAVLPMGAGTCRRCASCTCPDAPCRKLQPASGRRRAPQKGGGVTIGHTSSFCVLQPGGTGRDLLRLRDHCVLTFSARPDGGQPP